MTGSPIRILVADDEAHVASVLAKSLADEGYAVFTAANGAQACDIAEREQVHLALVDLTMPDRSGLAVLRHVKEKVPEARVIIMTAFATAQTAVEAMKQGALDYLVKPFSLEELKLQVQRAVGERELEDENRALRRERRQREERDAIIGEDPGFRAALELAEKAAGEAFPVLVTGESGTGKELVARLVHRSGNRKDGPFLAVNCGAIAESLLERELFGHEKGAFTGADATSPGLLEAAASGTLFLDEIAELPMQLQPKLLRVLDGHPYLRVGGTRPVSVTTRFVAATNRDLTARVREGKFREDLYHRLAVLTVHLPPLRARGDDVLRLAEHFLARAAITRQRAKATIDAGVKKLMLTHHWPGNARELKNAIERAVILANDDTLSAKDLWPAPPPDGGGPVEIARPGPAGANAPSVPGAAGLPAASPGRLSYRKAKEEFDRGYFLSVLASCDGNVTRAAKRLGLDRRTLQLKLKRFRIKGASGEAA